MAEWIFEQSNGINISFNMEVELKLKFIIIVYIVVFFILSILISTNSHANTFSHRWGSNIESRLHTHWDTIVKVSRDQGISPVLLAAICVYETGLRPIRGGRNNEMYGPCQVNCRANIHYLREHISEDFTCDDMLKMKTGLLAGAVMVGHFLDYNKPLKSTLCGYGSGIVGLEWSTCPYQRGVYYIKRHVIRSIGYAELYSLIRSSYEG